MFKSSFILLFLFVFSSNFVNACHQNVSDTTLKIGCRIIKTAKRTKSGTAVVPMWQTGTPNQAQRTGAGFPVLKDAEHAMVWQPESKEEGAYNHYACLIFYKGKFFGMWGNHPLGEDAPGQRVLFSISDSWGKWRKPNEIFAAPGPIKSKSEEGIHLKPDRWVIVDDLLYAVTYVHGAGRYPIARSVTESGTLGEPFLLKDLPKKASLPIYMTQTKVPEPIASKILNWYKQNDQVSWWADKNEGVNRKGVDGSQLIEAFSYRGKDDGLVLMLRNWGTPSNPVHNNRIYVSFKKGDGQWGAPYPTDIPDSPTRGQAMRLEDGTILLIGSQNAPVFDEALYLDRDPITVSISKDGYIFDRVYVLRTASPKKFRFSGVRGRNPGYAYSSSVVHNGWLYTMYSIGKEDMAITKVPLKEILGASTTGY